MLNKLWIWWTWRNTHKVTDPKLKKAMLRGIITPKEALAKQKENQNAARRSHFWLLRNDLS